MNSNSIASFEVLYTIQEDQVENFLIDKPKMNSEMTQKFRKLHDQFNEVEVLGFYGTKESISEYLGLGAYSQSFEKIPYFKRGIMIIGFVNNYVYLCYMVPECILEAPFQEKMEITLYRYLKDLCKKIIFLPPANILKNWNKVKTHFYLPKEKQTITYIQESNIKYELNASQIECSQIPFDPNYQVRVLSQMLIDFHELRELDSKLLKQHFHKSLRHILEQKVYSMQNFQQYPYLIPKFQEFEIEVRKIIQNKLKTLMNSIFNHMESTVTFSEKVYSAVYSRSSQQKKLQRKTYYEVKVEPFISDFFLVYFSSYFDDNRLLNINQIKCDFTWLSELINQQQSHKIKPEIISIMDRFKNNEFSPIRNEIQRIINQFLQQCEEIIQRRNNSEHFLTFNILDVRIDHAKIRMSSTLKRIINIKQLYNKEYKQQNYEIVDLFKFEHNMKDQYIFIIKTEQTHKIVLFKSDKDVNTLYNIKQSLNPIILFNKSNNIFAIFNCQAKVLEIQIDMQKKCIIYEQNNFGQHDPSDLVQSGTYFASYNKYILISNNYQLYAWEQHDTQLNKIQTYKKNQVGQKKICCSQVTLEYICDGNLTIIQSFDINRHSIMHLQPQDSDLYIMMMNKNALIDRVIRCENLVRDTKLKKQYTMQMEEESPNIGNTFLDILKGSLIKYGPNSDFLQIYSGQTFNYCEKSVYDIINSYFDALDIYDSDQLLELPENIQGQKVKTEIFISVSLTRVPVQLCTVQNSYPIQNIQTKTEVNLCSTYCQLCSNPQIYCSDNVWHPNSESLLYRHHTFSCQQLHQDLAVNASGIDIAFIMDITGSMITYVDQVQDSIKQIFAKAQTYGKKDEFFRFAFIGFKDHPWAERDLVTTDPCQIQDFQDALTMQQYIKNIIFDGGDDEPEAVLDGLNAVGKLSWRENTQRFVFLITDAFPHGSKYHNQPSEDSFYDGCPCKLHEEAIFMQFRNLKLNFAIIQIKETLNMTINEFKKYYKDLTVIKCNETSNYEFSTRISNLVVQQIQCLEITFQASRQIK